MSQFRVFLRTERKSVLAWSAGLAGFLFLIGAIYASFDDAALDDVLDAYPEELLEIFGGFDDLGSVQGFLSAEVGSYFPLITGIFAIMLMTKHTAGAEERGALDHSLSRPITRGMYYWSLYGAGATILALILVASAIGAILGFLIADAGAKDLLGVMGLMLEFWPLSMVYLSVGLMLGSILHKRGQANGIGIAVVLVFFIVDIASRIVDGLDWLSYWTPQGYLSRSDLFTGDLDLGYVGFCAALSVVASVVGALAFDRKNLYA